MEWIDGLTVFFAEPQKNSPDNLLYHYQSLVAGLLALLAAAITALALNLQHRELISRRWKSARSRLPLALSSVHEYCDACLMELSRIMAGREEHDDIREEIAVPRFPDETLSILAEAVELCDRQDSKYLQALLRRIQIQNSRFRGIATDVSPNRPRGKLTALFNLRDPVRDAYVLKLMCDHLFPYSRDEERHIKEYDADAFALSGIHTLELYFDDATDQYVIKDLKKLVGAAFSGRNVAAVRSAPDRPATT